MNFLHEVTEKDEKLNTAKYIRIQVWSERYAHNFDPSMFSLF